MLRTIAVAVAVAGASVAATPTWAKTAFQYWAQGEGAYVSSKDHPSDLYQYFGGYEAQPVPPPAYYDPYARPLPPAYPYGAPGY